MQTKTIYLWIDDPWITGKTKPKKAEARCGPCLSSARRFARLPSGKECVIEFSQLRPTRL